jgi:exopolysaccharide production protein ExoZ
MADRERLAHLDGLRAVAFLAVLVFHAGIWARPSWSTWILQFGAYGVDLFFVVSGFVMVHITRGRPISLGDFWRRRFLRLAVPYWIALAAGVVISWVMYEVGGAPWWGQPMQNVFPLSSDWGADLAAHVVILHGLVRSWTDTVDGAFWSLSAEWQFYLAFPFLASMGRRFGARRLMFLAVAVSVVWWFWMVRTSAGVAMPLLPAWVGTFAVGMFVAEATALDRRWFLPVAGVSGALAVALTAVDDVRWLIRPAWGVAFGGVVLVGHRLPGVAHRWLTAVGRASYSGYLVHGALFLAIAVPLSRADAGSTARSLAFFGVGVPAAVALSMVFHRWIEEPAHELARGSRRDSRDDLSSLACVDEDLHDLADVRGRPDERDEPETGECSCHLERE